MSRGREKTNNNWYHCHQYRYIRATSRDIIIYIGCRRNAENIRSLFNIFKQQRRATGAGAPPPTTMFL